jgi:hypothetical protein
MAILKWGGEMESVYKETILKEMTANFEQVKPAFLFRLSLGNFWSHLVLWYNNDQYYGSEIIHNTG